MEVKVSPGRYIIAVSGGVDSMVLLDVLAKHADLELIVGHFDHGIRSDSSLDREHVAQAAERYKLPFVVEVAHLGPNTSEAAARVARYTFLESARSTHKANAIITAHHEDDMLETAILNLLRGTGRLGLSSLSSRPHIIRPLLHMPKAAILAYAHDHQLVWREDSTNADDRYLRNYIRHTVLNRFSTTDRVRLLGIIEDMRAGNEEIDQLLGEVLRMQPQPNALDRRFFVSLPHDVAKEVLAAWLRAHDLRDFDARLLDRVTIAAKVQHPGAKIDLLKGAHLLIETDVLALQREER